MGIIREAEAVVRFGDVAYDSLGLQLKQLLQGEHKIEVARGVPPVVVFVSNAQVCARGRAGYGAKRGIRLEYKRFIGAAVDASRRDKGHGRLSQGSFQ